CNRFRFQSHALKVGRFPHVSGFWIPLEDVTFRGIKLLPPLIAIKNRRVFFIEHFGINGSIDDLLNFGGVWPNITEKYIVAFAILAQWFVFEVEIHGASQGIGNNQRRRRQVVHLYIWVNATLKVAVTRKNRGYCQIVIVNSLRDFWCQRAGVTDAGRAAVTDNRKTKFFQVWDKTGFLVVLSHDT